jgi:GTP-binding protein Era
MTRSAEFRAGYLAIVGCPNVGKSTLMNRLIGAKLSITSSKAQTTRHRIHGILTTDDCQYVFVDTPGVQMQHRTALNRAMNRTVNAALAEVDVILFVIDARRWRSEDREVLARLPGDRPIVLVINKVDRLTDKNALLPLMAAIANEHAFADIVPVSAEKGKNLDTLLKVAGKYLPEAPPIFAPDELTDRSERFLAAELLREKLFRNLGEELPYGIAVEIEKYEEEGPGGGVRRIHAAVIVDRDAHKAIVIGKGGERLKRVASDARKDMEKLFGGKVWLETWVKVKSGWADDERALKSLGYE